MLSKFNYDRRTNFPANIPHVSMFLKVFFTDKFKKLDITFDGMITFLKPRFNVVTELILVVLQLINELHS